MSGALTTLRRSLPISRILATRSPLARFPTRPAFSLLLLAPVLLAPAAGVTTRAGVNSNKRASLSSSYTPCTDMAWQCSGVSNAQLVDNLAAGKIVKSQRVYEAMKRVDRAMFVPDIPPEMAYMDAPQSIGYGATISAPHMHAMCLELLADHLKPGSTALDVGSGSGYLLAAMSEMTAPEGKQAEQGAEAKQRESAAASSSGDKGVRTYGIEHIQQLVDMSIKNLRRWKPDFERSIHVAKGDGRLGVPGQSFDAIHVGAAADSIPDALLEQLRPGGRLVIPVGGQREHQYLMCLDKDDKGAISKKVVTGVRYVPLTDEKAQLRNV